MLPGEGRAREFEAAVSRCKKGRCPDFSKGQGEPGGLKYREKSQDLFGHVCKKRWPVVVDLAALRDDVSPLEPIQVDIPSSPVPDHILKPGPSGQRLFGSRRLGRFMQRFPLWRSTRVYQGRKLISVIPGFRRGKRVSTYLPV